MLGNFLSQVLGNSRVSKQDDTPALMELTCPCWKADNNNYTHEYDHLSSAMSH